MSTKANYICAADAMDTWRDDLLSGKAPTLYQVGTGELSRIEVGPGLVNLVGGAPGVGKTSLTTQWVFDALRVTPDLKALICNIEMFCGALLDRQIARLAGINLNAVRHRQLMSIHADRLDQAMNTLAVIGERLCFVRPPFDLSNVAASADEFGARLILLDYIQRISAPGQHENRRGNVDATMSYLRQFADFGCAVIVVSAVGRGKDSRGRSTYDSDALSLASFRESSELEFGADSAFLLAPDKTGGDSNVILRHLKDRNGECRDMTLHFDKSRQSFEPVHGRDPMSTPERQRLSERLTSLWNRTAAAPEDEDTF